MSLSRFYSPSENLERMADEPFGLWGRHFPPSFEDFRPGSRMIQPKMDLYENADKNLMTATFELPGVSKENIQIDVQGGSLAISGETHMSSEQQDRGFAVKERRFGKFNRTIRLPEGTQSKDVKASMENGILTVTYPKTSPTKGTQRISID